MQINNLSSERQLTMLTIRWLGQVAECVSFLVEETSDIKISNPLKIIERCSDRIEHIAQYDLDGLAESTRLEYMANDVEWLSNIVEKNEAVLSTGQLNYPSATELRELLITLRERQPRR